MFNVIRDILMGYGAIILAPSNHLEKPYLRITLPPKSASQAVGVYFSYASKDLHRAMEKVRNERQLELNLPNARTQT
jgi:hypothetical protein